MMIRTLETLIYDCPNYTSNGPPKKKPVSKVGGSLAKLGGQDPPTPSPSGCALGMTSNLDFGPLWAKVPFAMPDLTPGTCCLPLFTLWTVLTLLSSD